MKRVLSVLLAAVLCVGMLTGCGNTNSASTQKEEHYADEDFMKDAAKALETRWKMNESDEDKVYTEGSDEQKELFSKWTQAELDILSEYEDEKFEDSKLKELAIQYINALKDQEEAMKYVTVDYLKFSEIWQSSYDLRTQIIAQLKEDYGLNVSEKYQSILDDLVTNAQLVTEEQTTKETVETFAKGIQFALEKDEYGLKTYSTVVENTTGLGFSSLSLTINLLDAEGVIVETTYANVDNFASGAKARLEFMTDKEFASTDISVQYYNLQK